MEKCVLCGRESEASFTFRHVWADGDGERIEGFASHFTIDEKQILKRHSPTPTPVCGNRRRCQQKQLESSLTK